MIQGKPFTAALLAALLLFTSGVSSDGIFEEKVGSPRDVVAAALGLEKSASKVLKSGGATKGEQLYVEGVLYFHHADNFESGDYLKIPVVEVESGRAYRLEGFSEKEIESLLDAGSAQVRVRGTLSGSFLKASQVETVAPQGNAQTAKQGSSIRINQEPPTSRPYRVGVLYAQFNDGSPMPWYDANYIEDQLFNRPRNIKDYYLDSTHNTVVLKGKYGFALSPDDRFDNNGLGYPIPYSSSVCDYLAWFDAAENLASVDGYDRADFDQIIFVTPQSSCNWSGIAGLANRKAVHINWNASFRLLTHEIGHNFGLGHAMGQFCWISQGNQSVLVPHSDSCNILGYGDSFDIMGSAGHSGDNYYFQMNHRAEISGLNQSQYSTSVTTTGVYQITPMEYNSFNNPERELVVPTNFGADTPKIYVEYRQPYGFDDFSPTDPVATGVLLRRRVGSSNILINNHPHQPMRTGAPLQVGETFEYEGAKIRLLSTSPTAATLYIQPGIQVCQPGAVTINGILPSPLQLQSGEPGGVVTVKAQNNGSVACFADVTVVQNTSPPVTHSHLGHTLLQPGDLLLVDFTVPTTFGVTSLQTFTADFAISGAPVSIVWEVVPGNLPCGQLSADSGPLTQMFPASIPVNQTTTGLWEVRNNGPLACQLDINVSPDPFWNVPGQMSFLTVNSGNLQPVIAPFSTVQIPFAVLPTSGAGSPALYRVTPLPVYPDEAVFGFTIAN